MDYWTHPEDHDSETRGDPWGFASFCAHWATLQDVFGDVSKSPSTLVAEFKWLSRLNEKRSCALLQVAASECAEYAEWPKRPCGCNLSKALLRSEVDMIIAGGWCEPLTLDEGQRYVTHSRAPSLCSDCPHPIRPLKSLSLTPWLSIGSATPIGGCNVIFRFLFACSMATSACFSLTT